MYVDALLLFSDAQAVTAAAASTNYIDLGAATRDIGVGEDLYVVSILDVAMTDSGSDSTLEVAIEGDSTTTFTPDSTKTLYTFSAASAAGTVKMAKLSADDIALQYAQLKYTPANGNLTTGSVTSFITTNVDKWRAYADGITIS